MFRFALLLSFFLGTAVAQAQFVSPGSGGSSPNGNGVRTQPDNVTDTFSGLTFQIERIVKDPGHENGLRLIMRVIESEKEGRRVSWVKPAATLVDEMGNLYDAVQSNGVPICTYSAVWDMDSKGCARYQPTAPVYLTPSQPIPVVILFLPRENNFSPDLAAMAKKGAFNARIAIFSKDVKDDGFYDIVINGIELPQGGG